MIGTEERTTMVTVFGADMTIIYDIAWIACDHEGCDAKHVVQSHTPESAWDNAKKLGWTWDGGTLDGCPQHPISAPTE